MLPNMLQAARQAAVMYQQGQYTTAMDVLLPLLSQHPPEPSVLNLAGLIALKLQDYAHAEAYVNAAIEREPDKAGHHNLLGLVLRSEQRFDQAEAAFMKAIELDPQDAGIWVNLGNLHRDHGNMASAEDAYRKAISTQPEHVDGLYNLGLLLAGTRPTEAEPAFRAALRINPNQPDVLNDLGNLLADQFRSSEAEAAYRQAIALAPGFVDAVCNLGILLMDQRRFQEAANTLSQALRIDPNHADSLSSLGNLLTLARRHQEAESLYRRALVARPDSAPLYNNLGNLYMETGRLAEAEDAFRRAVTLQPDYGHALGQAVTCARKRYAWERLEEDNAAILTAIRSGVEGIPSFMAMAISGANAQDHLQASQLACQAEVAPYLHLDALTNRITRRDEARLKIGYLSADFREHAVMHLFSGVLRCHDRDRFQIFGYSIGGASQDIYRNMAAEGCEHFIELDGLSDQEAAKRILEDDIDILVNLTGHTKGARPGILAARPAPVLVNWLGYPGSLGQPRIADYIIGDPIVTPLEAAQDFSETIAQLPHCYLPADDRRPISSTPTRLDVGLPPHAFVFCSFSQAYKLTPSLFDLWCRLLQEVPGSVLWLSGSTPEASSNLREQARARGIGPDRLIFATKLAENADHLARLPLADLALDTFPFTSHTTASDALWAGVPLITLQGQTFVSRVAASLLHAVGLPELITHNADEYFENALRLAQAPEKLGELREKLARQRITDPLFNSPETTRALEQLYVRMWQHHSKGDRHPLVASGGYRWVKD